jgi:hypothetical protein
MIVLLVSVSVVSQPTSVVVSLGKVIAPTFEIVEMAGVVRVLLVRVCAVEVVTSSELPTLSVPDPPLYQRVPPALGLLADDENVTDFTPAKLLESLTVAPEFCIKALVVPSNHAIALSVDGAGPETSPPTAYRFSLPNIKWPVA